ncbi:hypothetical protein FA95DRAFT_140803 [Auriscalpium vulgare]|uniref:Uncharacterized protein n=1 Tax=Auriscalpium vulgare TaxID=40419 RepID=A0ACB8S7C8_9AGAM|nr:hypothetical protein FA95DRAFT_140803 [Auriscalpium vulgare]
MRRKARGAGGLRRRRRETPILTQRVRRTGPIQPRVYLDRIEMSWWRREVVGRSHRAPTGSNNVMAHDSAVSTSPRRRTHAWRGQLSAGMHPAFYVVCAAHV